MKKLLSLTLLASLAILFNACDKVEDLPFYEKGSTVTLSASSATVAPTLADSNANVMVLNWSDPKYGQSSSLYKFIIEMTRTGNNFAQKVTKVVTGSLTDTIQGRDLNNLLLNLGLTAGTASNIDVRVVSSYGNNNERYISNVLTISAKPFADPAVLSTEKTTVTGSLANASQPSNTFSWTQAFKKYTGTITYTLQYDSAGKNFANVQEIPVGVGLLSKALNQGEMNQTALSVGVVGGTQGKVDYRIKAVTASGSTAFSNTVSVVINSYESIVRLYLPGGYQGSTGNGNDWDPPTAPEFIRDTRSGALNKLYYIYIYLPAGAEFKVTEGRSWTLNYGGTGGNLAVNGANFSVATAGYYRISIDRTSMQYDIREGRMGFVGGGTPSGWDPPSVFPARAMGLAQTNLFVGLTDFTVDGWKLIDNNAWNNGDLTVTNTRSYGSNGGSGSTMEVNGANFPNMPSAGRYRVMWDGRNPDNIKYEYSPATEMRVVGDGISGVNAWDPGVSPQMTYQGDGKWQITLDLVGGKDIKFLAGNAWGAFDYEDNSGGSTATGVARKIRWEGGDNFKTPVASGTYTITLDEKAQTVTIN